MAWYLEYAKKKYPEQYRAILANSAFRKAFTLLYDRFDALGRDYETEMYRVEKALRAKGFNVVVEDRFFMIMEKKGPSHGSGHHMDDIRWLKSLFTPQLEATLMVLRN